MEMHLRLSVKTNCRIFKELTRPLSRAHAMSSAISLEIALLMTRCDTGCVGGASRDRTDDLRVANATLSQLSYGPSLHWPKSSRRFRRRLDARPNFFKWWVWEELNLRPHPYQGCALTN